MTVERHSLENVEDFLAQKRIAIIGISRNPADFSVKLFEELCRRGYDVIPVNPGVQQIGGRRCFARVQDIRPPVDAVLLMTSPNVTETIVRDCAAIGIPRVWMYRAGGRGSVSQRAVAFCHEQGIRVVPGQCPLMFLPNAGTIHRLHGFIRRLTGRYPQRGAA
ncbi:MAG TPA: CoA-binding protein [Terriglobales bacterium]|nr:CoA-binding protein [Terriglobales bacterium]